MLATTIAIAAAALAIEGAVGYPAALFAALGHPVTWIGRAIAGLDGRLNRPHAPPRTRLLLGFVALALVLLASVGLAALLQATLFALLPSLAAGLAVAVVAASLPAQRSLDSHVRAVADALAVGGVAAGREAVGRIVGRDTRALDEAGVARAAIESLAENFSDGIVAPAVWLALGGLPGGVAYKAVNTADSMIGHRTPRHDRFGFAAAKLDDVVNWPCARLAASWIVLAAALTPGTSAREAWRVMRRDAGGHASPNAGWPEAAMAGALGVVLGGARSYGGRVVADATMGDGTAPLDAATIGRALRLYRAACAIDLAALTLLALLLIVTGR